MNSIINWNEKFLEDSAIEKYEVHEYNPINGTNLNNPGEIRISINLQDIFTHPSESYLIVEGRLTKDDGAPYVDADNVALINNGIMHLFDNINYEFSGHVIENVNYLGVATTLLGLLKYPKDFETGLNQLWCLDDEPGAKPNNSNKGFAVRQSYIIQMPDAKGTFSFKIPLKHIFGFCEDYDKIVYGFSQTLTLTRKSDNDAIYRNGAAKNGKITLNKIAWYMPHVNPALSEKLELMKSIENKSTLPVAFRGRQCDRNMVGVSTDFTWRLSVKSSPEVPRYIIVGFQTNRDGNQEKNPSVFDHCDVSNIHVTLNSIKYPEVDYQVSFPKMQFSRVYGDAIAFRQKFDNINELVSNPNISPYHYKDLYPLFVFDVSKQSEQMKNSISDIHIKARFHSNVPANTYAYAVIISDKILNFQADGNKMSVIT